MPHAQSITPVNTNKGWAVCQHNDDGTDLFLFPEVYEPHYSQADAKLAAEHLRQHLDRGGHSYAKPLPPGVQVLH